MGCLGSGGKIVWGSGVWRVWTVWRVLFGHRWNDDGDGELCLDTDGMIIVGASGASCLDTDGYHS